jgi:CRP-like cAMP-binding protein
MPITTTRRASPVLALTKQPLETALGQHAAPGQFGERSRNALLGAMPADDFARFRSSVEWVDVAQNEPLFRARRRTSHVYFPNTAVVSLTGRLGNGETTNGGSAGCEGLAGLHVFLESDAPSVDAIVQIAGVIGRVRAIDFRRIVRTSPAVRSLLHRYADRFLNDVIQTASCNALHRLDQRCARWLLSARDRVGSETFRISQQSLASMLNARTDGIVAVFRSLQDAGLIRWQRGHFEITDARRLLRFSCPCYRVARARFAQLGVGGMWT